MIFFKPQLFRYENHELYKPNTYVIITSCMNQHLICRVEKFFWIIYIQKEREFKTWDSCIKEIA